MNPQEVLDFAQKNEARQLDLRFTDIPSLQHHVSYPMSELGLGSFEDGFGMDGSSIRGWAAIHESDMLLIPDPSTAFMDPFAETPTLVMYGDVIDPITKQHYERDRPTIIRICAARWCRPWKSAACTSSVTITK
jgi:glutamine synthetase